MFKVYAKFTWPTKKAVLGLIPIWELSGCRLPCIEKLVQTLALLAQLHCIKRKKKKKKANGLHHRIQLWTEKILYMDCTKLISHATFLLIYTGTLNIWWKGGANEGWQKADDRSSKRRRYKSDKGPMHGSQNIPFKKIVLNKKCDQYYCTIFYQTIFSFNFI